MNTQQLYDKLKCLGYIKHDQRITQKTLELFMNITYDTLNPWLYLGPLLELKAYMKEQGYITTTRGLDDEGFYIRPLEVTAPVAFKELKVYQRRTNRMKKCILSVLDSDDIDDKNKAQVSHASNIYTLLLQNQRSVLQSI